jgi:hypothetical protein
MDSPFRGPCANKGDGGKAARERTELYDLQGKMWVLMRGRIRPGSGGMTSVPPLFCACAGNRARARTYPFTVVSPAGFS